MTRHMRPPGLCHCWSVRLEQSPGPWPQPKRHRSCLQTRTKDIFVRTGLVQWRIWGDALYKSTRSLDTDMYNYVDMIYFIFLSPSICSLCLAGRGRGYSLRLAKINEYNTQCHDSEPFVPCWRYVKTVRTIEMKLKQNRFETVLFQFHFNFIWTVRTV